MSELWSVILGAGIGGIFSITATVLTLRWERKKQKESDIRLFQLNNAHDDRERKIQLYIELLDIIRNTGLAVHAPPVEEGTEYTLVDNDAYSALVQKFAKFCEENAGLMELYLPYEINSKIMRLRRIIYQLSVEKKTTITASETKQSLEKKMEECGLLELKDSLIEVRSAIRKDIEKDAIELKRDNL